MHQAESSLIISASSCTTATALGARAADEVDHMINQCRMDFLGSQPHSPFPEARYAHPIARSAVPQLDITPPGHCLLGQHPAGFRQTREHRISEQVRPGGAVPAAEGSSSASNAREPTHRRHRHSVPPPAAGRSGRKRPSIGRISRGAASTGSSAEVDDHTAGPMRVASEAWRRYGRHAMLSSANQTWVVRSVAANRSAYSVRLRHRPALPDMSAQSRQKREGDHRIPNA